MTAAHGLALLRIGLGFEFAVWGWDKAQSGWLQNGTALADVLSGYLPKAEPIYGGFLQLLVLPNVDLFARLVTVGEWAAALALTFGLFTRAGSLVGMWLTLNFMFMRGFLDVAASIDRVFFLACLICFVTSAGRVWGLEALRRPSRRVANTWANPRAAAAAAQPSVPRAPQPASQPALTGYAPAAIPAPVPVFQRVLGGR